MNKPRPDPARSRRPVIQQLAGLAEARSGNGSYEIDGSDFIRRLNALKPIHSPYGRQTFTRERPTSHLFITFIFDRLGVDTQSPDFQKLFTTLSDNFTEQVDGLSVKEQQEQVRDSLPANSQVRQAFQELDIVVGDFHGNLYDGELKHAQLLGCFIVASALSAHVNGLQEAS